MRIHVLVAAASMTFFMGDAPKPPFSIEPDRNSIQPFVWNPLSVDLLYAIVGIDPATYAQMVACTKKVRGCEGTNQEDPTDVSLIDFTFDLREIRVENTTHQITYRDTNRDGRLDQIEIPNHGVLTRNSPEIDAALWSRLQVAYGSLLSLVPMCIGDRKNNK